MDANVIRSVIVKDFAQTYNPFQKFASDAEYAPLWDLLLKTASCRDNMIIIRFCNDVYNMPPVKVFADICRSQLNELRKNDVKNIFFDVSGNMHAYIKRAIGAFWSMVFRFALGYTKYKSVAIVKERYYGIQTASRFYFDDEHTENNTAL